MGRIAPSIVAVMLMLFAGGCDPGPPATQPAPTTATTLQQPTTTTTVLSEPTSTVRLPTTTTSVPEVTTTTSTVEEEEWRIDLLSVDADAFDRLNAESTKEIDPPEPGFRYVLVEAAVTNLGSRGLPGGWLFIEVDGDVYRLNNINCVTDGRYAAVPVPRLSPGVMDPGVTATGYACVEIPRAAGVLFAAETLLDEASMRHQLADL